MSDATAQFSSNPYINSKGYLKIDATNNGDSGSFYCTATWGGTDHQHGPHSIGSGETKTFGWTSWPTEGDLDDLTISYQLDDDK